MQIIPAIDIIDGKCVRLTQGDYVQKTVYNDDPLVVARMFEEAGLQRLHLVDLDGAKAGTVRNWKVLEAIAGNTNLSIDFSGGIKTENELERVFNVGADFAAIGSLAVKNPAMFREWLQHYSPSKFLLGADVKNGKIAVGGWMETTDVELFDLLAEYEALGLEQVFCTDVSKDGLMQGPAFELYAAILDRFPGLSLIASGGVRHKDDLEQLQQQGCKGAIVGKAFYEGHITLKELFSIENQSV
jgi:phosphoribosylformimino-5-aminoimidazole carboxamide ribotide isomerase